MRKRLRVLYWFGIRFETRYSGDVIWIWPWKRHSYRCVGKPWYSVSLNASFASLRELCNKWHQYERAHFASGRGDISERIEDIVRGDEDSE